MKKIISALFAFTTVAILFSACKDTDTYADKLEKEEEAINQYIIKNGIAVTNKYPESRVFKDKEYYKDPNTGIYIHVIDSGTPDKITKGTTVYMRFYDARLLISEPDSVFSNDRQNSEFAYMSLDYGNPATYSYTPSSGFMTYEQEILYYFLSPGCAFPLDFNLGNNAEVSLIIPFINGSSMQTAKYEPIAYGRLKYTFIPDQKSSKK